MKSFLEEYGLFILSAIVILTIVLFCTPLGKNIGSWIEHILYQEEIKEENRQIENHSLDVKGNLSQNDAGDLVLIIQYQSTTETYTIQGECSNASGGWPGWKELSSPSFDTNEEEKTKTTVISIDGKQAGRECRVRFKLNGRNEYWIYTEKITIK